MGITNGDITGKRTELYSQINKRTKPYLKNKMEVKGRQKYEYKLQYLLHGRQIWKSVTRPEYMNKLTRLQTSTFFKACTWKLSSEVKNNFRNMLTSSICRAWRQTDETREHVLEERWHVSPRLGEGTVKLQAKWPRSNSTEVGETNKKFNLEWKNNQIKCLQMM